jgi:membrane fusion protein, copper/silver efflux system
MQPDSWKNNGVRGWLARAWAAILRKPVYLAFCLMILAAFGVGAWFGSYRGGQVATAGNQRILYYVDPMNPAHTSPKPGLAPCGMKMEPVYADRGEREVPPANLLPGAVKITPQKQQMIGVRVGMVEKAPYTHTLRALGTVAIDETRVYRLISFVEGWMLKVFDNSTGSLVMKDEPLATYYSRDFLTAQQSYLYSLSVMDRFRKGDLYSESQLVTTTGQIRGAEENLENLGMSKSQIKDLSRTRRLTQDIFLRAPVTSFILSRNVSPGQKISKGDDLYKLVDLSRVWIIADLYENEAQFIRPGLKVRATLSNQNRTIWATVSEILPTFDRVSRTLKVRLETDNFDYSLKPDMFVDLEFPLNLPEAVMVPVDAILDSGLKKTVFVDRDNGYFEPRQVETGWRFGDRVQVLKGLEPGQKIVVSGNFLIDSESRMRLAAAGMFGEVTKDPVCGLNVDQAKAKAAGLQSTYKEKTYYFCSDGCQQHFQKNPQRYGEKKTGGGEGMAEKGKSAPGPPKDPVCGLEVDQTQAKAGGLTSEYQGKTYYFCRYSCNKAFDKDPEGYLKKETGAAGKQEPGKGVVPLDPVSGVTVDPGYATALGLKREYKGKTYYFRQLATMEQFNQAPESYLDKAGLPSKPGLTSDSQVPKDGGQPLATAADPQKPSYLVKAYGLDKETKLPEPLTETPVVDKDPVCGIRLGEDVVRGLTHKTSYQGKLYFFCSEDCKRAFDLDPERYVRQLAASPAPPPGGNPATPGSGRDPKAPMARGKDGEPQVHPSPPGKPGSISEILGHERDPVCGMELGRGSDHGLTLKADYQGKTYYFCSAQCQKEFIKDPLRYLNKIIGKVFPRPQVTPLGVPSSPDLSKSSSPPPSTAGPGGKRVPQRVMKAWQTTPPGKTPVAPQAGDHQHD